MIHAYYWLFGFILWIIGGYLFLFGHANRTRTTFYGSFPIIFALISTLFFDSFVSKPQKEWMDWILVCIIAALSFLISY